MAYKKLLYLRNHIIKQRQRLAHAVAQLVRSGLAILRLMSIHLLAKRIFGVETFCFLIYIMAKLLLLSSDVDRL